MHRNPFGRDVAEMHTSEIERRTQEDKESVGRKIEV
jgi:hypothetical protein